MRKEQLEEILRAASVVAARGEFILFGSQAVHAITTVPPAEVLVSRECDVWLEDEPALHELPRRRRMCGCEEGEASVPSPARDFFFVEQSLNSQ